MTSKTCTNEVLVADKLIRVRALQEQTDGSNKKDRALLMDGTNLRMGFAILAALITAGYSRSQGACPDVTSASSKELITLLELHGRNADPECVRKAIVRVGDAKDASAIQKTPRSRNFKRRRGI